jgi:hypothetical protein
MRINASAFTSLSLICAISGCFRPPAPKEVDASGAPGYARLVGQTDYIERGFYVYWDSQKNYAFLDGGDVHALGVTKLMTVEGSVEVKIDQVLFEVYKEAKREYEFPSIVVSFKNPADDKEVRGRVSPVYLKYASKLFENQVFPRPRVVGSTETK